MEPDDRLPVDPELEAGLQAGLEGIHRAAVLVGALKRELEQEGFTGEEAYNLCEAWLVEALMPDPGGDGS